MKYQIIQNVHKDKEILFVILFNHIMEKMIDKIILITGGTTGIGRATASLLCKHGATVFIFGRHKKELDDAMSDIKRLSQSKNIYGSTGDVTNIADIEKIFEEVDRLGHIDVLINNAGIGARSVLDHNPSEIDYIVKTNLIGYLLCAKKAVFRMRKQGGGNIINIGSLSAEVDDPGADLYVATKSGIRGFTNSLRKLESPFCIHVSLIETGSVGTDMTGESPVEQRLDEKKLKMLMAEDIANAVLYILTQPKRVEIMKIQIRPHLQII